MRMRPGDLHILPREDRLNWTRPPMLNNWTWYVGGGGVTPADLPFLPPSYTVDELGYVCLRGLAMNQTTTITANSGSAIFRLPNDLRLGKYDMYQGWGMTPAAAASVQRIDITPSGDVMYVATYTAIVYYLSLAGIRFKPDNDWEV